MAVATDGRDGGAPASTLGGGRRFSRAGLAGSIAGGASRPNPIDAPGAAPNAGAPPASVGQALAQQPFLPNGGGALQQFDESRNTTRPVGTMPVDGAAPNNDSRRLGRGPSVAGGPVNPAIDITNRPNGPAETGPGAATPSTPSARGGFFGGHRVNFTPGAVQAMPNGTGVQPVTQGNRAGAAGSSPTAIASPYAGVAGPKFTPYATGASPGVAASPYATQGSPRAAGRGPDQSAQDFLKGDAKSYADSLNGQVKAYGNVIGDEFQNKVGNLLGDLNGIGALRSGAVQSGVNDLMKTYGDRVGQYADMTAGDALKTAQGERDTARNASINDYQFGSNLNQRGSEFDRTLGQGDISEQRRLGQEGSEFDRSLGQRENADVRDVTQRGSEFDRQLGQGDIESQRGLAQRGSEFDRNFGEGARQFDENNALNRDKFNANENDLNIERQFRDRQYGDAQRGSNAGAIGSALGAIGGMGGIGGALEGIGGALGGLGGAAGGALGGITDMIGGVIGGGGGGGLPATGGWAGGHGYGDLIQQYGPQAMSALGGAGSALGSGVGAALGGLGGAAAAAAPLAAGAGGAYLAGREQDLLSQRMGNGIGGQVGAALAGQAINGGVGRLVNGARRLFGGNGSPMTQEQYQQFSDPSVPWQLRRNVLAAGQQMGYAGSR